MSTLFDLQEKFQHYLLTDQHDIQQSVISTSKVPALKRLSIYKEAYEARLLECLGSNFPCLMSYLGHEKFNELGLAYIHKYPSNYRSVRWFGDKFPDYLKEFKFDAAYLSEFAEFEWKMTLAFDAPDTNVFKVEQMSAIPGDAWGNMVLIPHPSLQRMTFYWNVVPLWQTIANNTNTEPLVRSSEPVTWVLWRSDYINRFYSLAHDEAWAMDAMITGATFSELCEGLCQWLPEEKVVLRVASLLKKWIQSGLLADINIPLATEDSGF